MGCWFFKQPNGLYGRFSTVVDTVTHVNMTEDDIKEYMADYWGRKCYDLEHFDEFMKKDIYPFKRVLNEIRCENVTTKKAQELLIGMGMPEEEARKYHFDEIHDYSSDDFEPFLIKDK